LIDVRTTKKWKVSAINGSKNIPITRFTREAVRVLNFDKDKPVVDIYLTVHRGIPAVSVLKEMGFTDVKQLQGGVARWWVQKFPLL